MGSNTHRIQTGHPQGQNPNSHCQVVCWSAQEQESTPFEFNILGHEVNI